MANLITKQPATYRDLWGLVSAVGAITVAAGLILWLLSSSTGINWGSSAVPLESAQAVFTEATGVRLVRVAVTAGGGMLDLRYQVIDPDKAAVVHDQKNPPTIVDEFTGQTASRPWMHHSSGRELHAAVTYNELLLNPGGVIKPGSAITVIIGGTRLEHVIVQ
ncbi:MAG: hypothetical protein U0401_19220 [Anaerolineae bacterium]